MSELRQAYLGTRYCVFDPALEIRIGEVNKQLDELLEVHQCTEWAFITAWNPFSKVLSVAENQQRHEALKEQVRACVNFEGEGIGEDPAWAPERSLLILGIPRNQAIALGRAFEQHAIVCGTRGQEPELVDVLEYP